MWWNTRPGLTLNRSVLDRRAEMDSTRRCSVEGCDRRGQCAVGLAWLCAKHYARWKRHGDPTVTTRRYSPPNPDKRTCAADGCRSLEDGACGYCKMHYTRIRRHGSPHVVIAVPDRDTHRDERHERWTGDQATYSAMHQRVAKKLGRAASRECVDCGRRASHWSYDRLDPDERVGRDGPYSVRIQHYVPRCVPCHKAFDLRAIGIADARD